MSNTLLAIIGTMVSMLAMVGFSVIQLDKLSGDDRSEAEAPRQHESL